MENNFNLKKFLVENKLTTNSKLLKEQTQVDLEQAFHKAGVDWSEEAVVIYQSVSGTQKPEIYYTRPDDLLTELENSIEEYGGDAITSSDSRGEELLGYNEPICKELTYKLEVLIQDDGVYEIWQDQKGRPTLKADPSYFSSNPSVNPSVNEKKVR